MNNVICSQALKQHLLQSKKSIEKIVHCLSIVGKISLILVCFSAKSQTPYWYYTFDNSGLENTNDGGLSSCANNCDLTGPIGVAGIRFRLNCTGSRLYCNTMEGCYHVSYLHDTSTIVSDQGTPTESWKNQWINNVGTNRVDGSATIGTPPRWLYNTADANTFWVVPSNPFYVTPTAVSNSNGCTAPLMQMNAMMREENFSDAVHDTIIPDPDSAFFKYGYKEIFYSYAKENPAILNLGAANDVLYQQEFSEIDQGNIGVFDDVEQDMMNKDNQVALAKLYSLQDQNVMEYNKKFALQVCIIYSDTIEPDAATLLQMENIAYQHPFYGGEAVWIMRARLHLDIEDDMPQFRRANTQMQNVRANTTESNFDLVPNPSNSFTTLVSKIKFEEKDRLEIADAVGEVLVRHQMPKDEKVFSFRIASLKTGIYFCRIIRANKVVETKRLIVMH